MKPTIRNKLVAGFASVLVLMAAVAGIGGYAVLSLRHSANDATRIGARLNSVAIEIQVHNLEAERNVKKYLTSVKAGSPASADSLETAQFEMNEIQSLVAKAIAIAPTAAMRAKFEKTSAALTQYNQALKTAVDASKNQPGSAEATAAVGAYADAAEALHESAEDGEVAGRDASQASLEDIEQTSRRSVALVGGIALLGLVLGIAVSYKLGRAILLPVQHLQEVAENVSLGNLDMAVRRYSEDEIGDLADSFSRMVTAVKYFRMEAEASEAEARQERGGL
jgi:HAMP domain-containing protein